MSGDRVRPFSNGSQFMDWNDSNCGHCAKYKPGEPNNCEIDDALMDATMGDGTIPKTIANRMGHTEFVEALLEQGEAPCYGWPCPERESPEDGRGWDMSTFRRYIGTERL